MNVAKLMKILADKDPEAEVILSSDPEGNDFRRLEDVETRKYKECADGIDIWPPDEVRVDGSAAVVLWP
jgi:hypothetical protein